MRTFKLDGAGDLVFDGQNNLAWVDGLDEKRQDLRLNLGTVQGEFFLDFLFGVDYFSILGAKPTDTAVIRAALLEALERNPRVDGVGALEVSFDRASRRLVVSLRAFMGGDEVEVDEEVEV